MLRSKISLKTPSGKHSILPMKINQPLTYYQATELGHPNFELFEIQNPRSCTKQKEELQKIGTRIVDHPKVVSTLTAAKLTKKHKI